MKKSKKNVAGPFQDLYRQSACQANQLAEDIFSLADTQRSRELLSHLQAGEFSKIVSASINPLDYTNADTFSRDYLCVELMSKYPHWDLGINRSAVALGKFAEVEERLKHLSFRSNPKLSCGKVTATMRVVEEMTRRKIAKILGDFSWNEAYSFFAFGPGASTSLSRRRCDASFKFGALRPHMSYNAEILAHSLSRAHPTWQFTADVVAGSKLITVPKNAKTDRSICVEPDLNMYFQKGIGKCIRRRLQRWGLLKPDAQQYNAELARQGSANGRLATVDLSSASDSIHNELVGRLLPSDWVTAIEQSRSPFTVLPNGELRLLRKVSSMGNGFTFELETLIFYCLATSVIDLFATKEMDRRCTVFGDDIIIASELVEVFDEVLCYFGFEMNPKKSFWEGAFRESCGKHYFSGIDVTPFYVRDRIDSVHRKYWAANTIKRYSRLGWGLDPRYKLAYSRIVDSIPLFFQGFKIPDGYGDGGLVYDWDEVCPSRSPDGYDSWSYTDLIPRFKRKPIEGHGNLLKVLHVLEYPSDPVSEMSSADKQVLLIRALEKEAISGFLNSGDVTSDYINRLTSGVLSASVSDFLRPNGYKKHVGVAQRWPSFGPWLDTVDLG